MATESDTTNAENVTSKAAIEEEFNIKSWRTDLTLKVEDRTLYVSKAVLGLTSPVFEDMFDGETKDGNLNEISLPGKKHCDVVEFLRCIYPNIAKPISDANVLLVFPLAIEYKVDNLKQACELFLLECLDNDISTERLCAILDKANSLNIQNVFEKSLLVAETRPFEDLDIAFDKMSKPLEEKYRNVTRMFVDIKKKYENLVKQHNTARVLCRILGEVTIKQKHLVDHFLQDCVTGETTSLAIKCPWNDSKSIEVGGYTFAVSFVKPKFYSTSAVKLICDEMDVDSLECVSLVIVRNWMTGKDNIMQWNSVTIEKTNDTAMEIFKINNSEIYDETKGFIFKEVCNIDIFLFVKQ